MGAAMGTKRRIPRRGADTRAAQLEAAAETIAAAEKLSNEAFFTKYIKPSAKGWPAWTHPKTREKYTMRLTSPEAMRREELEACYAMIELTSGQDYRSASVGWHPEAKRIEMRSPGLRYILVQRAEKEKKETRKTDDGDKEKETGAATSPDDGAICAFTSFMPTFEENQPIVYCYEIHLLPSMEKGGLGTLLMNHVVAAATNMPTLEKTMLTCFLSNTHAMAFYARLGFAVDDSSPPARKLRGKVIEPEYAIMSRPTNMGDGDFAAAEQKK